MRTTLEKRIKRNTLLSVIFVVLMIIVFGLLLVYFQNTKRILEYETNRHLKDNAQQVCEVLDYRVDIQMERLQTITYTYEKYMEMHNKDGAQIYLNSRAKKYMFRNLEVITPQDEEGKWEKYSKIYPFQQSMKGQVGVAYIKESPIDGKGVVLYTVPYVVNGEVQAILTGERTKEKVSEILQIENFSGQGKYLVVDYEGDVLAYNKNVKGIDNMQDFYEILENSNSENAAELVKELEDALNHHKSGSLTYLQGNKTILVNYSALESADWMLISVVEESVLSDNSSKFIRQTICVIAIIEVILSVLVTSFVRNNRIYNKNLENIAYVDPVTKGNTMARFEELYNVILKYGVKKYALVTLDIDKFKLINDVFGSEEGDKTLKYVYDKLNAHISEDEIIARGQADVFYMLKEFTSVPLLMDDIRKMKDEIKNGFDCKPDDKYAYKLAVSVGTYVIENKNTPLIIAMDRSTVARKKKIINYNEKAGVCHFYSEEDRIKLLKEKEIINHMEPALLNNEFEVYLQPKCDTVNSRIKGAEALIRWNDPKKGMVYPNEFIPVLEKTGFIVRIDLFVFEKCCQLVQKWIQEGKEPIVISLNLSRMHFLNPDFLEPFIKIKDKYQVPASCFEMEITETVICQDVAKLVNHIDKIHEAGFACSLDDFGSGYSSLNILKNINVDVIKLDRAFFEKAADNKGRTIIASIIALAHKLNMSIVAEGIETSGQVQHLKEMECDLIQGYVFSRPIPIPEFEKMLKEQNNK